MTQLTHLTVLGSGVLGGQIAWHSAYKGKTVVVHDIDDEALQRCRKAHAMYARIYPDEIGARPAEIAAAQARLSFTTDLAAAVAQADLVIECVPEIPAVKTLVYTQLAPLSPAHTLVATNTSTLLPSEFADATGRPAQYCALHFANLIWKLNVVEVMAHRETTRDTLAKVTEFALDIGMVPVAVQKEQNGYVLNTWLVALLNAAQSLVTNGVSTPEDVDRTYLLTNRGATMGPMGIMDMVGMKTVFDVLNHWGRVHDDEQMKRNAAYVRTRFVDRGILGLQTGEGYYRYPEPSYRSGKFLQVPDRGCVADIVERSFLGA